MPTKEWSACLLFGFIDTYCVSLNVIDPYKLIGSSTIRRCGLVSGSVSLWEKTLRSLWLKHLLA